MSIRRKLLASELRQPSMVGNPLHATGTSGTRPLRPSDREGGRCDPARSHPTQYPPLHELCHALVGEGEELGGFSYGLEEVVVESTTYIACSAAGLATDVDSIPYVAGWAGDEDPQDLVRQAAAAIDTLARSIEDMIAGGEDEGREQGETGAGV